MKKADIVRHLLDQRTPTARKAVGEAEAPANIALCKYWGKRDPELNLPVTSSLSIALPALGTRTRVSLLDGKTDVITLDGKPVHRDTSFAQRLTAFLDLFRTDPHRAYRVDTHSTVPVAAGLASSASGFAALVKALDHLYDWQLPLPHLSILARLGSGSACRSLFDGFSEWHAGNRSDGMDSYAEAIAVDWPELCVGVVTCSAAPKPIGSREAMQRTVSTSPLYAAWPDTVQHHLTDLKAALQSHHFEQLGRTAEANAMAMHATMHAAWPSILYWLPETIATLQHIHRARADGIPVYCTMDAGPNVKLLFESPTLPAIQTCFPGIQLVRGRTS